MGALLGVKGPLGVHRYSFIRPNFDTIANMCKTNYGGLQIVQQVICERPLTE